MCPPIGVFTSIRPSSASWASETFSLRFWLCSPISLEEAKKPQTLLLSSRVTMTQSCNYWWVLSTEKKKNSERASADGIQSATKFVGVLVDALKPERNASQHLINLKGSARQDITAPAMGILSVLKRLLSSLSLSFYPSSASAQLASESARQLVFPELIEKLLELVEKVKENKQGRT